MELGWSKQIFHLYFQQPFHHLVGQHIHYIIQHHMYVRTFIPGLYNTPGMLPLEDMTNRLDSFPLGSSSRVSSVPSFGSGPQLSSNQSQTSPSESCCSMGELKFVLGAKGHT